MSPRPDDADHSAVILVVEDDPAIGRNLQRALAATGYDPTWVTTAADAIACADPPDLVLLDLGLPDGDGVDVARRLHERWPAIPIIMLTARAEEIEVVVGLDAGAVDYVTKPFRLAELLARIRAQLRISAPSEATETLSDGDLHVDLASRRVFLASQQLELRTKEYDLLVELLGNAGRVMTREDLMANVWDEQWFGSTKTLDVHIAALRRRLGEEPGGVSRITVLRGVGYRWDGVTI